MNRAVGFYPTDEGLIPSRGAKFMTEKEKYFEWLNGELAKGLVDIKYTINWDADFSGLSEEDIYRELNEYNNPKNIVDFNFEDGSYIDDVPRYPIDEILNRLMLHN